jgi:hypothetical protein
MQESSSFRLPTVGTVHNARMRKSRVLPNQISTEVQLPPGKTYAASELGAQSHMQWMARYMSSPTTKLTIKVRSN